MSDLQTQEQIDEFNTHYQSMADKYNRMYFQNNRSKNYFLVESVFPSLNLKTNKMEVCYHLKKYNEKVFKYVYQSELDKNYALIGDWIVLALKMKNVTFYS